MLLLLLLLSLINGLYMLIDGIYVMIQGKYIGPEEPGPWSKLFDSLGIMVFRMGPVFIIYGILWLAFVYGLYHHTLWAYSFGMMLSFMTLWYLPFGTIISVIILVGLIGFKGSLGL